MDHGRDGTQSIRGVEGDHSLRARWQGDRNAVARTEAERR